MSGLFYGSGVALVTPFFRGEIDYVRLGALIDWQISEKTDALIICGTTGEASTMTDEERMDTIAFAVSRAQGRVPVIAGTGANDTRRAIVLSERAEAVGADALLVVTPYYNKANADGLVRHYTGIADHVSIPVIAYNVPSRTGVNLTPHTMVELARHPRIQGIKEASGNIAQISELAHLAGDGLFIYSGNDADTLPILSLGGRGVISVAANIVPRRMHDLVMHFLKGDFAESQKIQLALIPLMQALFCDINPIPVKAALSMMDKIMDELRLPLTSLNADKRAQLKSILADFDLLPKK